MDERYEITNVQIAPASVSVLPWIGPSTNSGVSSPIYSVTLNPQVEIGRLIPLRTEVKDRLLRQLMADVSMAVETAFDPIEGLRVIVSAIKEASPLPPIAQSFDELLTRAAASRGIPGDLAAWADQLAGDTGDLTD